MLAEPSVEPSSTITISYVPPTGSWPSSARRHRPTCRSALRNGTTTETSRTGRSLEMAPEPVDDALEPVDPAIGPARREHQVRLARVADHLDRPAEPAEGGEDDFGLVRRAAQVVLALEEEERRLVPVDRRGRGSVGQPRRVVPEPGRAGRDLRDRAPVVARAEERSELGDWVLADRRREPAGMLPEEPVRHVSAVREAEEVDSRGVAEPFRDGPVDDSQEVVRVAGAPIARDRSRESLPVAGRAARVRVHHGDAGVCEREHLEPGRRAVGQMGAAVDLEDERRAPSPASRDEPRVELVPLAVRDPERLRVAARAGEPAAAVAGERPEPVLDRVDLARAATFGRDGREASAADGEVRAHEIAGGERLPASVETEAVDVACAAV